MLIWIHKENGNALGIPRNGKPFALATFTSEENAKKFFNSLPQIERIEYELTNVLMLVDPSLELIKKNLDEVFQYYCINPFRNEAKQMQFEDIFEL